MSYERVFEEIAQATKLRSKSLFSDNPEESEESEESEDELLSVSDYLKDNNLDDSRDLLYERWIKWHNNNSFKSLELILKSKKLCFICKLLFFVHNMKKESNIGARCFTLEEFNNALDKEITLWRGGKGTYNPSFIPQDRSWVSYTASRNRANTFSKYDGTHAMKTYMLPENDHYWIVELKVKLRDILAFYDVGDNEVIISAEDSKKAKLIVEV